MKRVTVLLTLLLFGCASYEQIERDKTLDEVDSIMESHLEQQYNEASSPEQQAYIRALQSQYNRASQMLRSPHSETQQRGAALLSQVTKSQLRYEIHRKQLQDRKNLQDELKDAGYTAWCAQFYGASVIAEDETYLGELTPSSIYNEYSTHGSEYSSTSIWNEYSTYGSEYSSQSPWNAYSSSAPTIVLNDKIIGRLTINEYRSGAVNPAKLGVLCFDDERGNPND